MEPSGLVDEGVGIGTLLRSEVLDHLVKRRLDLRRLDSDREFGRAEPARPAPHVTQHFVVEPVHPLEVERG